MSKRTITALIAGTTIASGVWAQAAAAAPAEQQPAPQGQSGVAVDQVPAPAIDPASDAAPQGVDPRVVGFKQCGGGTACIFRGANYSIWKVTFPASYAGGWRWILITDGVARRHYSAKNRFGNRKLVLRGTRANGTWRRVCLNPGGSRPGPLGPGMLQFKIGAAGSRC